MIELTMAQIVAEYNKLTGKNIKKFETKTIGLKKLNEARNAKPITDKQLGTILTKKINTFTVTNPPKDVEALGDTFSQIADQIVKQTSKKTYTPKQLEVELGKNQLAIRKKLRKLFPDKAKQGAWRITLEMLDELRKVI